MKNFVLIAFILIVFKSFTQNIVTNWSFENFTSCPTNNSGIYGGNLVPGWRVPPGSIITPDYFNTCYSGINWGCDYVGVPDNFGGNCLPRTGEAYAGILMYYPNGVYNFKEYIHQELSVPMIAGQCYEVSFWVQLADYSGFSVDKIGAYISNFAPIQNVNLQIDLIPTINSFSQLDNSSNWFKIYGDYLAVGGERFITIGDFYHDTLSNLEAENPGGNCILANGSSYYYIDDVSVCPCSGIYAYSQTICEGETVTLKAYGSNNYVWEESSTPGFQLSNHDSLLISPVQTTSYLVYGDLDTTVVTVNVLPLPKVQLRADTTICPETVILIEPLIENADNFWWQDGNMDSTRFVNQEDFLILSAFNNCGTVSDSLKVSIDSLNLLSLSDVSQCEDEVLFVSAFYSNANYLWSNGSLDSAVNIQFSGEYWVQLENECGKYIDTFNVELLKCTSKLTMPNVFSPNDDGNNDFFIPVLSKNITSNHFAIINRWGETIYENDFDVFWDGKNNGNACVEGTYFWSLIYTTIDGEVHSQQGIVQLIR